MHNPVTGDDPNQGKRNSRHDDKGSNVGTEPAYYKEVDENHDGGKGKAQVTKDLIGDLPFPIPLHGVFL